MGGNYLMGYSASSDQLSTVPPGDVYNDVTIFLI